MTLGEQWTAAMRSEDYEAAWAINDAVLRELRAAKTPKHEGPRHLQQIWRGEPLEGAHVLLRCYHGLGDTLQFIRFAAPLRSRVRKVTVWCQTELCGLVSRVDGVDCVLPLHDGIVDTDFDIDLEVMELPHALRMRPEDLSCNVPYLACRPAAMSFQTPALHVGLNWRAGDWDGDRSIPLEELAPVTSGSCKLYALRPGEDLSGTAISDLSAECIEELAGRISNLDMVVTVDTMIAHLAGALARPVLLLLQNKCDWRWGRGSRTTWYPTMQCFRQIEHGDWSAPVAKLARVLCEQEFDAEHRNA